MSDTTEIPNKIIDDLSQNCWEYDYNPDLTIKWSCICCGYKRPDHSKDCPIGKIIALRKGGE